MAEALSGWDAETREDSAALIDATLARKGTRQRFPPILEARFERDTGPERCRMLARYGLASLILYNLCLFNYFAMLPDVAWRAFLVQIVLVTPTALLCLAYALSGPPPLRRETMHVLTTLLSLAASMAVWQASTSYVAVLFRYGPLLTLLFINVVAPARFSFAVAASVIIVLCNVADLWRFEGATADVKMMIASSVVWASLFTLLANYRLEKEQRRAYLLKMRERLRRDEVTRLTAEQRAAAERIHRLAHHDALTGLANRTLLSERVSEAIDLARHAGTRLAVFCLDLDGFKAVNDLHSHAAGDHLLREVAARLGRSVRETDTVARLGGDEFVVLQNDPDQPAAAHALAKRLVSVLSEPYDLGAGEAQGAVTASIGIALFPGDGIAAEILLHNADTALYNAKWAGKNGAAFFHPEMDCELRERLAMERDLRLAAIHGEFALDWQPRSAASDGGAVTGFEVLLRWDHPERGLVPPDLFIPKAEACGVIAAVGAWVLREACHEAARWTVPLQVAVNVSPLQAQKGEAFAGLVEQVLAASGLDPSRLVLEVTEGVLIHEAERVLVALRRLKALGVQVALNDFGTGYSSLATLRAFPFDKLKIDRSFVAEIRSGAARQDIAIVQTVLALARGLGVPVLAEGVETEAQLGMLRAAGCEEVQGWLVGRPAPIESFAHFTRTYVAASAA